MSFVIIYPFPILKTVNIVSCPLAIPWRLGCPWLVSQPADVRCHRTSELTLMPKMLTWSLPLGKFYWSDKRNANWTNVCDVLWPGSKNVFISVYVINREIEEYICEMAAKINIRKCLFTSLISLAQPLVARFVNYVLWSVKLLSNVILVYPIGMI